MRDTKALARRSLWSHLWQGSSLDQLMILMIVLGVAFATTNLATCAYILLRLHMEWSLISIQSSSLPAAVLPGACLGAICWGAIAERIGRKRAPMYTALLFMMTCFFMGVGIPLALTLLSACMLARVRAQTKLAAGILALVPGGSCAAISAHFLLPGAGWTSLCYVQAIPALLVVVMCFQVAESPCFLPTARQNAEAERVLAERQRRTRGGNVFAAEASMVGNGQRYPPSLLWYSLYRRRSRVSWLFRWLGFFHAFLPWLPTTLEHPGYFDAQSANFPMVTPFFRHLPGPCRSVSVRLMRAEMRADYLSDSIWRFPPSDCRTASASGTCRRSKLLLW